MFVHNHPLFPAICCSLALSSCLLGCSDQGPDEGDTSTGGNSATGGISGSGGGDFSDGGTGSGGAPGGGSSSGGSSSGGNSSGGTGSGGHSGSGGAASTGGSGTGGGSATGGANSGPPSWPLINGMQWADTEGNPIQAHGGGMFKVGEDYYWFGENRNPDGTFYAVSAYRSRDLHRWEHAHDVLTMNTDADLNPANVERPKVVYNESTGKYVMWMHWENGEHYGEARAAVASSDTVDGDYVYHGSFRPYQDRGVVDHNRPGYMSRDCTLFVDDDKTAYFLSASNENYDLHLYSLSADYLSVDQLEAKLFVGDHREAPALFKRGDIYFLVTSGSTGWDPNQARYATSTSLVEGWSGLSNVGNGTTFYSQSTYVLPVEGSAGTEYLYMGDRWAGAWGGRVNDSYYLWQPIEFSGPRTMSMEWYNTLELDTTLGTVSGSIDDFRLVNKGSGLVLAVDGAPDQNSSDLVQSSQGSATGAVWRLDYDGDGYFRLQNVMGNKVADIPDESTTAGQHVHLWDGNGGDHQSWRVIDLGEGDYRIMNKNSGLFLGVENGSSEEGTAIQQQADTGDGAQVWTIVVAD